MAVPAELRGYRVFFSHGGEDTFIAERWSPDMQATGAQVFVDNGEIHFGDDFRERVFDELGLCDELVILLTPSAVKRPWVFAELGAATLRGVHIVAIRYGVGEDELRALGILSILGTTRLLTPGEFARYLEQLRARVQGKLV